MDKLRQQTLVRYISPLREGGSLPALGEADDGFKYVVKFRGAGHGTKALIAELIGGETARAIGLKIPELVLLDVPEEFGAAEPDPEVQDLLKASRGLNLGMHFLSGALALDPYSNPVDAMTASKILWLDAFLTNIDRTARNANMLLWHGEPWVIDNGASLYFHHAGSDPVKAAGSPFPYVKDHLFLGRASMIAEADKAIMQRITPRTFDRIVELIPDDWLVNSGLDGSAEEIRDMYRAFLKNRLKNHKIFVDHALEARKHI